MLTLLRILLLMSALLMVRAAASAEAGTPLPREVSINGVELVLIPAGWFWYTVGIDTSKLPIDTRPHRDVRVWLDSFYLAKYEARASDLRRFMKSGATSAATLAKQAAVLKEWEDNVQQKRPECTLRRQPDGSWALADPSRDLPATNLTWALANEFAAWMGLRLPTEAQWEKGARGTDKRIWPWGNTYPDDTYGRFGWGGVDCDPAPVDAYPKGRSPYGLYNMAGNVGEYVADWFNQGFDDALTDGMRNPPLALQGSPVPEANPQKISKGGVWTTDSTSIRIETRRPKEPYGAATRDGVRFAANVATVRAHLARQAVKPEVKR
jgi:formylglycine-generating enzyme